MGFGKWIVAGAGLAVVGGVAYAQYRDTEEPAYDVLFEQGKFELRQYAPMIVAQVSHTGDRRRASTASFRRLAAYIFGQDRGDNGAGDDEKIAMTSPVYQSRVQQDEKIAMTAPVMQDRTGPGEWRMRFVMPSQYTMASLPTPPSDVAIEELPGRRVAAVRFSGVAREADLAIMEARLSEWIERQGYIKTGDVEYAFYDAPMVPGPLRRNEVLIPVEAR